MISVIIPTYNRVKFLTIALKSILEQSLPAEKYEILVIDNNSTDTTKKVVSNITHKSENRLRYIFEPNPGLVNARHRGAEEARGEILVFADDDIIASPEWLAAINEAFEDPNAALVGGKVLPEYEAEPPEWLDAFWVRNELGSWMMYLSLIDLGEQVREVPANYVFGCNFSIRKNVLYQGGGFHPDSFPSNLIRYRGDGEYGLALEIMRRGYKTIYHPKASVKHQVTKQRMTANYFCCRSFYEGISNSYTEIRQRGEISSVTQDSNRIRYTEEFAQTLLKGILQFHSNSSSDVQQLIKLCYEQGRLYHHDQASSDPELLKYVFKKDYYTSLTIYSENYKKIPSKLASNSKPRNLLYLNKTTEEVLLQQAMLLCEDAKLLLKKSQFLEALAKLDEAMYHYPQIKGLQTMRATCLLRLGRNAEAEIAERADGFAVKQGSKTTSVQEKRKTLKELHEVYNQDFYEEQKNDSLRAAKVIVPLLLQHFEPVNSVVDIGCGVGTWLSVLFQHNVKEIKGFDTNDLPPESYFIDKKRIETNCDFSFKKFQINWKADLALCLEVGEHLPELAADLLVRNLVNIAPVIIFSAAFPGQTGVNHINEQPLWYWREKFNCCGYAEIDFLKPLIWSNPKVSWWYRQNITSFVSLEYLEKNPKVKQLSSRYPELPDPHRLTVVSEWILKKQFNLTTAAMNKPDLIK